MEFHHDHQHGEEEDEGEGEGEEMALPINTTYAHNNHHHILPLSLHQPDMSSTVTPPPPPPPLPPPSMEEMISKKMMVVVRYRECLKNHAASMGGKATDGCGEFMASGEEGTLEALTCAVCNCHRNFHRKEVEGDHHRRHPIPTTSYDYINYHGTSTTATPHLKRLDLGINGRNLNILQAHHPNGNGNGGGGAIVPYNMGMGMGGFRSESEEHHQVVVKKRFRTKFTQEQKEKMVSFAERVGWKIQRQEESVVQHFCQEIGIKRRVLKVWMHNNKQNLASKNIITNSNAPQPQPQPQDPN